MTAPPSCWTLTSLLREKTVPSVAKIWLALAVTCSFAAEVIRSWLGETGSGTLYVAPGSPWQNGYAESFHSKVRDEFLDREEFESEPQARALGALWKEEYFDGSGFKYGITGSGDCASAWVVISTKAKPRALPVSRSMTI